MRLTFRPHHDPTQPPLDREVPAERLFRLLLRAPRAELPIEHRIPAAPHLPLVVRALRGVEEAAAWDDAAGALSSDVRDHRVAAGLISRSLFTPKGRAFTSSAQVGELLSAADTTELAAHVLAALCIVSPTYGSIDLGAWEACLEKGARHVTNAHQVAMLADCVDVSVGYGVRYTTPRPDRYFGLPIGELTDGHHLVFSAARSVVDKRRSRDPPP